MGCEREHTRDLDLKPGLHHQRSTLPIHGRQRAEQWRWQPAGAPIATGRAHLHTNGLLLPDAIAREQPVDRVVHRVIEAEVVAIELGVRFAASVDQPVTALMGSSTSSCHCVYTHHLLNHPEQLTGRGPVPKHTV